MRTKDLIRMCLQNLKRRKRENPAHCFRSSHRVLFHCDHDFDWAWNEGVSGKDASGDGGFVHHYRSACRRQPERQGKTGRRNGGSCLGTEACDIGSAKGGSALDDLQITVGKDDRYQAEGITVIGIPDEAFEKSDISFWKGGFLGTEVMKP